MVNIYYNVAKLRIAVFGQFCPKMEAFFPIFGQLKDSFSASFVHKDSPDYFDATDMQCLGCFETFIVSPTF